MQGKTVYSCLSWFLSCFQQWFKGFNGFKRFKGFEGLKEFKRAQSVQKVQEVQEVQWDHSNDCLSLSSPFLFLTISHPRFMIKLAHA